MRLTRGIAVTSLALSAGCFELDLGEALGPALFGGTTCVYCYDPVITGPYAGAILLGDTVRLRLVSPTSAPGTWSTSGNSLQLLDNDLTPLSSTMARSTVLAKGVTAGTGFVYAVPTDSTTKKATHRIAVVDSSAIDRVMLTAPDSVQLVIGTDYYLLATLSAANEIVAGRAALSSSDTTIVAVTPNPVAPSAYVLRGRRAGTARVIASFRQARDTLMVRVVP